MLGAMAINYQFVCFITQDSNAMNSMMSNHYKNSNDKSGQGSKRKADGETDGASLKKIIYPSPNALQRNLKSTGLVGPRRTQFDKYFIDRKGDKGESIETGTEGGKSDNENVETREATIQKFLGCLPSRTSYSAYVRNKGDNEQGLQKLYRVFKGAEGSEDSYTDHSGITSENVGISRTPPKSPVPAVQRMEASKIQDIPDPRLEKSDSSAALRKLEKDVLGNQSENETETKSNKSMKTKKSKV